MFSSLPWQNLQQQSHTSTKRTIKGVSLNKDSTLYKLESPMGMAAFHSTRDSGVTMYKRDEVVV